MIDFEALIKSALKDGETPESLAEAFTNALNTAPSARDNYIKSLDPADPYDYLTIHMASENPNWDETALKDFHDSVISMCEIYVNLQDIFN